MPHKSEERSPGAARHPMRISECYPPPLVTYCITPYRLVYYVVHRRLTFSGEIVWQASEEGCRVSCRCLERNMEKSSESWT